MKSMLLFPALVLVLASSAFSASADCGSCDRMPSSAEAEAFFASGPAPQEGPPAPVSPGRMGGQMGEMMPGHQMPGIMQGKGASSCSGHAGCHCAGSSMRGGGMGGGPGSCGGPCGPMMGGGNPGMPMGGGMGPQTGMGAGSRMGPPVGQMFRGMGGEGGPEEWAMLAQVDLAALKEELKLTDAQVEQLRGIYRPLQKESVTLAAKLRVAEMEILDLVEADKTDLGAVGGKVRDAESIRSQLRMGRVAAWQKAKAVLTADQRKALEGCRLAPCGKPCRFRDCGMGQGGACDPADCGMGEGMPMRPGMMNR